MSKPALVLFWAAALTLGCSLSSCTATSGSDASILFQDSFSDTGSGWDKVSVDAGVTGYQDGVYRIYVNDTNSVYWANPGRSFTDVRVEVEATKVGGSDDNFLGLICRYRDTQNHYFALISSDGFASIEKFVGGQKTRLSGEKMVMSDAVEQGNVTNTIRLDCIGNSLTLFVNGTQVQSVSDPELASGDVGLIAGTYDVPGTDIHFDNFVVRAP